LIIFTKKALHKLLIITIYNTEILGPSDLKAIIDVDALDAEVDAFCEWNIQIFERKFIYIIGPKQGQLRKIQL
jgi:hypothetical protein